MRSCEDEGTTLVFIGFSVWFGFWIIAYFAIKVNSPKARSETFRILMVGVVDKMIFFIFLYKFAQYSPMNNTGYFVFIGFLFLITSYLANVFVFAFFVKKAFMKTEWFRQHQMRIFCVGIFVSFRIDSLMIYGSRILDFSTLKGPWSFVHEELLLKLSIVNPIIDEVPQLVFTIIALSRGDLCSEVVAITAVCCLVSSMSLLGGLLRRFNICWTISKTDRKTIGNFEELAKQQISDFEAIKMKPGKLTKYIHKTSDSDFPQFGRRYSDMDECGVSVGGMGLGLHQRKESIDLESRLEHAFGEEKKDGAGILRDDYEDIDKFSDVDHEKEEF